MASIVREAPKGRFVNSQGRKPLVDGVNRS